MFSVSQLIVDFSKYFILKKITFILCYNSTKTILFQLVYYSNILNFAIFTCFKKHNFLDVSPPLHDEGF